MNLLVKRYHQRMQTGQFKSAPDVVRLIVAKEGFKGLYAVCVFWHLIWLTIFILTSV
jgi:hypothetical protein